MRREMACRRQQPPEQHGHHQTEHTDRRQTVMPGAGPITARPRQQAPGHTAEGIGADVQPHRPRPLRHRQFLTEVGHRRRRHARDAGPQRRPRQHEQEKIGRPGREQREQCSTHQTVTHQPFTAITVSDQAERNQQQGHQARAGGHTQARCSRGDGKTGGQLRQQRLRTVEQQETGKTGQRNSQRAAHRRVGLRWRHRIENGS